MEPKVGMMVKATSEMPFTYTTQALFFTIVEIEKIPNYIKVIEEGIGFFNLKSINVLTPNFKKYFVPADTGVWEYEEEVII